MNKLTNEERAACARCAEYYQALADGLDVCPFDRAGNASPEERRNISMVQFDHPPTWTFTVGGSPTTGKASKTNAGNHERMTLREYYAGQAMAGICGVVGHEEGPARVAKWSVEYADALIAALKVKVKP